MSAEMLRLVEMLRRFELAMAVETAGEAAAKDAEAAARRGRPVPTPKPLDTYRAEPLPIATDAGGSLRFDLSTVHGDLVSMGALDGPKADAETLKHAAARCIATARMLLEKAGEK